MGMVRLRFVRIAERQCFYLMRMISEYAQSALALFHTFNAKINREVC